jgi:hypothetical protein
MSIQRPTVQFNLVSGLPELESFCQIRTASLAQWIFSHFFASTQTLLFVPEAQHCLHIQIGTTDFFTFLSLLPVQS